MAAEEKNPIGSTADHGGGHDKSGGDHGGGGHGGGGHGGGGGHAGGAHEEHEGVPEWMVSFADNTALIMGFFAILLAMTMAKLAAAQKSSSPSSSSGSASTQPAAAVESDQMLDWVISVRSAFRNPVQIESTNPNEAALVRRLIMRGKVQDPGPKGSEEKVQSLRRSDFYSPSGTISFEQDGAELLPASRETLTQLATLLKGKRLVVEIRGHASAVEASMNNDKGVRLSFDRATKVGDYLVTSGLDWRQLRIVACGDNERVVARAYDAQQNKLNSRAEIFVTEEVMPDY